MTSIMPSNDTASPGDLPVPGEALRPYDEKSGLLGRRVGDDGAVLGLAVLLAHLGPALALAAVLSLAAVLGAGTPALALAGIDAGTLDLALGLGVSNSGNCGGEESGDCRRYDGTLDGHGLLLLAGRL